MAYQLKQYFYNNGSTQGNIFMTPVSSLVIPIRLATMPQQGVLGDEITFYNEAITGFQLTPENVYYFHTQIKRLGEFLEDGDGGTNNYIYDVYLTNSVEDSGNTITDTQDVEHTYYKYETGDEITAQFIKRISINPKANKPSEDNKPEWIDVEFVFKPFASFNTIVFQLQRMGKDYQAIGRISLFAYKELSVINDIKQNLLGLSNNDKIVKLGVQSRPHLLMCINGEEIRTSLTGIFELKNGIIPVTSFSVVTAGELIEAQKSAYDQAKENIDTDWGENYNKPESYMKVWSVSYIQSSSDNYIRNVDSFLIDYLYRTSDN